jgi:5-methylcytosine-specific restriction endonuclease McrA
MSTGHLRNTATRDRHRAAIRARRDPCGICHQPIDYTLRSPHPQAFEVDHVIARNNGGHDTIDNKQASHRLCNQQKGDREAPTPRPEAITTTRTWWTQGEAPPTRRQPHPAA